MTAHAMMYVDKATFFRFIQTADEAHRYEWVRGWIMQQQAGGTYGHVKIGTRFVTALANRLDPAVWGVSGPDRGIDTGGTVRYADVVVEREGADAKSLATTAPVVIVEVLSPSSEERDLGAKPAEYLDLPSLEAYIVASQDEPACYVWVRDGSRQFAAAPAQVRGREMTIDIPALSLSIPLADIYRGILDASAPA
jgi:Uma2 family endonuclease